MKIDRHFTTAGTDVFSTVKFESRTSRISNHDGSVVFEMTDAQIPKSWSQLATDIMVSKYFRKAGVPQYDAAGRPVLDEGGSVVTGPERSAKQVIHRLAGCWRHWGETHGYFDSPEDAGAFYDELCHMLLHQMAAPNSPQWFNTGLNWAYGITGPAQGHFYCDPATGELTTSENAYEHPQPHACFIQSCSDDLVNPGGIMDLWTREARLFKYGSGCTSGDSRVYVEGEGFLPLRDLYRRFEKQGRPVQEFDGKGRYMEVGDLGLRTLSVDPETGVYATDRIERVWQYDVAGDDKLTVRFDTGAKATVSAWHPFLVWDGSAIVERRADQLGRGDTVIGPNETAVASMAVREAEVVYETTHFRRAESHRVRIDADLAWLCGYFMGDGSLGTRRLRTTNKYGTTYEYGGLRLRFHDETVEVLDRVRSIIERTFGESSAVHEDGRGSNGRHLAYTGRKATGFFAALFGVGAKAHRLKMPQFVWESGPDHVAAFLAGLVDSDGWVRDGRAIYSTASHAFAGEVAALAGIYGFGGGVTRDRSVSKVAIVRRTSGDAIRHSLAKHLAHPNRRARLLTYQPSAHERKFCMPLSDDLATAVFGEGHAPADWLRLPVGGETLHLGRLQYEGLVNPTKLERGLALLDRDDVLGKRLARIARSAAFVTSVEPCAENPDFYDLTVEKHSNYLAGENGFVAIHNTGTNFSKIRGDDERLSGGGKSSGLMSFLKIGDRAAGAIKSGGTTRRAAKMCCLDLDHPDIEDFVNWKVREEIKVACLAEGFKTLPGDQKAVAERLGLKLDYDFNGEAYATVSGQNSNNSVRIPNSFFEAVETDGDWTLTNRVGGEVSKTIKARDLWDQIAFAAWRCADPGVQYDTTINQWHTCPESGRINASNPCVTGDTRVLTPGGIWRRIDQMIHLPSRVVTNLDGQEIHVTEGSFPTGTKEVFELTTEAGYSVKLTADHKVWTANRGWTEARDLAPGDEVKLPARPACVNEVGEPQDARLFHLAGLLLSDANGDPAALHLDAAMAGTDLARQYGTYIAATWAREPEGRSSASQNGGGTMVATREVAATFTDRRMLSRLGAFIRTDRANGRTVQRLSDDAFTAGLAAQKHLLRGLFTADGLVTDRTITLPHVSAPLLADVQLLLLGFGVKSSRTADALEIDPSSLHHFARHVALLPGAKLDALADLIGRSPVQQAARQTDRFASLAPLGKQQVFDLTEPTTSSFIANGLTVHNCSEYMFLDDTACNLASLNVMKFFDAESQTFNLDGYRHAIRIWTVVLEISVLMASFPSEEIARLSYKFRTLGLGYANLGAMLMQAGVPYDSEDGRAVCAALSSILTGESYAASAEIAGELGAFPGYAQNTKSMLRVIRNHRRAAYDVAGNLSPGDLGDFEQLDIAPVGIDADRFAADGPLLNRTLLAAARDGWDRALVGGEAHGYRNAQATVIAPTGTIGLLMDCDTTGVEPDFALVKFKKLSGGGYFKIANQSLRPALSNLGYADKQVAEILHYVMGTLTLHGAPHVNYESLKAKGFTDVELEKITKSLPAQFELGFAFSPWSLSDETLRRLGVSEEVKASAGFSLLRHLGFTKKQVDEANDVICGRGTVEGAPHLKASDYPVFDCANKCGRHGTRYIAAAGHIRMMAAAQPFISGAISKTINLPNDASVEDIKESYRLSWELGLKANALYRDGSKLSQPLNVKSDADEEPDDEENVAAAKQEVAAEVVAAVLAETKDAAEPRVIEKVVERIVNRPMRRRLPDTRRALTHKFDVAGHEGYVTVGLYPDGAPGEVFITMAKEGSTIGGLMDTIATLVSVSLQYGVPIESLVRKFEHVRFEPNGMTRNRDIPFAKSLTDYIFRYLAMEFVPGYRAANAPKREGDAAMEAPLVGDYQPQTPPASAGGPGGEPVEEKPKKSTNGHGPRMEIDTAKPFEYAGESAAPPRRAATAAGAAPDPLSQQGSDLQSDAPACDVCGSITVRSGTCYKCLNCGNSMGCS